MNARAARSRTLPASEAATVTALVWGISRVLMAIMLLVVVGGGRPLGDALKGWDAAIYTRLAETGYTEQNDHAFFPGLPLVLRGLSRLGADPAVSGAMIALVCSALAAWALYRLGSQGWGGSRPNPATGAVAASLWLLAPTTVFTTVAYTEAPFCAAAFWAWERARARAWSEAALLAAIACTLRVSGLFLVGALLLMALFENERRRDALWLLVPVMVLATHVVYLHGETGSWTAWYEAQKAGWGREFTGPLQSLKNTWDASKPSRWPGRPLVGPVFFAEIVSMLVGIVVTLVCLFRRRWSEAGWVGVQVIAFASSFWFMSVNRAVLLWFPLYLMVAALLTTPLPGSRGAARDARAFTLGAVLALSTVVALAWAWLYYSGQWAS